MRKEVLIGDSQRKLEGIDMEMRDGLRGKPIVVEVLL